jgi:hypothetical protein
VLPALCEGIPGATPSVKRLRCAHVAAALVLMGGDTTPLIHGLSEEVGLRVAFDWAWYTGVLVEAHTHEPSSLEVFRLRPEAVQRLHKVWYLHRVPSIQKVLKFEPDRGREAQRAWLDAMSLDAIASAVLRKVAAPVGVPGQPVRSAGNMSVIIVVANARLLQWGLSPHPDATLFLAREGLKALPGHQFGPWTTSIDWDMAETGTRRPRGATSAPPPPMLSAAQIFTKYGNVLSGIDTLPSKPKNERRSVIVGQLLARGAMSVTGDWKELKRLLVAALNQESPPVGAAPANAPVVATATAVTDPPAAADSPAPEVATRVAAVRPTLAPASGSADAEVDDDDGDDDDDDSSTLEDEEEEGEDADEAPPAPQRYFCCTDDTWFKV